MKPILFNTEMVRAILDGRKTQTRRILKAPVLSLVNEDPNRIEWCDTLQGRKMRFRWNGKTVGGFEIKPPYLPGDILYVRETWAKVPGLPPYVYKATCDDGIMRKWRPSIHMPKEAARIFLRVTYVRAERLQNIKSDECVLEGAVKRPNYTKRHDLVLHGRYKKDFAELWDSTIKPADMDRYGWAANPWVWVISFQRWFGEVDV